MLPEVDPMFSNSNSDFESSTKKDIAACLSSGLLLESNFIVLEMALVFAMISCMSGKEILSYMQDNYELKLLFSISFNKTNFT